jgi:hypothetical protein
MNAVERLPDGVAVRYFSQGQFHHSQCANGSAAPDLILPGEPLRRARELLAGGTAKVYLGHAALVDASAIGRLSAEFGRDRIGVYVPVKRMEVSWAIDTLSNADFKFMRPSVGEPCWEILDGCGERTGTHAAWWIGEMLAGGASSALVRVEMEDDADLNICAGLVERFGERLWLSPHDCSPAQLARLTIEGKAHQLVLPAAEVVMETAA